MKAVRRRLLGINRALEQSKITPDQWTEEFDKILYDGHYQAYELGMKRGGVPDPDVEDLEFRARQLKDQESDYLQGYWEGGTYHRGFVEDVRSTDDPRYFDGNGALIPGSLDSRTDLYVGKMRGSANEGFADASSGDSEFDWDLGNAEHCDTCPEIAAMSPYTWDTLWTTPGAGDCECLGNCKCSLVRRDGMTGFGRVDFEGSEADDFDAEQPDQPSLFARIARFFNPNHGPDGRFEEGEDGGSKDDKSGSLRGIRTSEDVHTLEDLKEFGGNQPTLPKDDDHHEYYYHAFRYGDQAESAMAEGIGAHDDSRAVYLSKDEIRRYDDASPYAVVRVPKGSAKEGRDIFPGGPTYREWELPLGKPIPPKDILRMSGGIKDEHGNYTGEGEYEIARWALETQGHAPKGDKDYESLAPKYKAWFNLPSATKEGKFAAWLSAIDDRQSAVRQFHEDLKQAIGQEPGTVDRDAHQAATSTMNDLADPSDAQKRAGNYRMGHTTIAGLDITIENPSGSRRRPEWSPMSDHYGYIRGTVGFDKDHLDVFVKPGTPADYAGPVFVVNQANSAGDFDEHKCMIGWESEETALAGYLSNYTSGQANRVISVATMSIDEFKSWAFDEAEGPEYGTAA